MGCSYIRSRGTVVTGSLARLSARLPPPVGSEVLEAIREPGQGAAEVSMDLANLHIRTDRHEKPCRSEVMFCCSGWMMPLSISFFGFCL